MREIELKFAVDPSFDLPGINGRAGVMEIQELPPLTLRSVYYDTVDLRLARNGVTLRYRTGENGPLWTLKLPTGDRRAAIRDEIDFSSPAEKLPEQALDLVAGFARTASLREVATLETKRDRWKLLGAGDVGLAVVYRDEVALLEDERVLTRFREIELESLSVDLKQLTAIGEALRGAGAIPSEPVPKAVRALGPRATAPPDVPAVPELGPEKPSAQVVKAFLVGSVDRLIAHHAAARLGNEEGVHQMRVAVRRLRSHLRTFAPLVEPTWSTEIVPDLKWLADLLGEVRDLDVLTERFEATAGDLHSEIDPLFDALRSAQEKARTALYGALRGERYRALLEKLVCSSQNPPVTPEATRPPDEVLIPQVASTWKRLRKAVRAGGKRPDSQALHEIRIRAKRARYAAEAVAGSLGDVGPKAKRFAAAAARVQDVLGEHQDAVVAQEKIRAIVGKHPHEGSFAVAAGRLIERQTRSAAEARKAWPRAWKELDRRKRRSWLKV